MIFQTRQQRFDLTESVLVMGVVNTTPDSFSDGGDHERPAAAVAAALAMIDAGADIIDVGGESTRPGAPPVDAAAESARVLPVVAGVRESASVAISIDTTKAAVAEAAVAAGADIINDISGFTRDPAMAELAAATGCGCIAMHMRGTPQTMQRFTEYGDLIGELTQYFTDVGGALETAGVRTEAICYDPGIGFSKTVAQNLELLRRLGEFAALGRPILVGASRKSFIGKVLGVEAPRDRIWGTAAACAAAVLNGARIIRVHDVHEMRQVVDLASAIRHS
jgi:dihydropteroate synthase